MNAQIVTTKLRELFNVSATCVDASDPDTNDPVVQAIVPTEGAEYFRQEITDFLEIYPTPRGWVDIANITLSGTEWEMFFDTADIPVPVPQTQSFPRARINPQLTMPTRIPPIQLHDNYITNKWGEVADDETVGLNGECTRCKKKEIAIETYLDTDVLCLDCTKKYTKKCNNCSRPTFKTDIGECDVCLWNICKDCAYNHDCFKLTEEKKKERRVIYKKATEKHLPFWTLKDPYRSYTKMYMNGNVDMETDYIKHKRFVGVEIEAEGGDLFGLNVLLPEQVGISKDGSLNATGIEIQTPPANGIALEQMIKEVCSTLRKKDYRGTVACGLHVHIDATGFIKNKEKLAQIIKTYYAIEDIIFSVIPPSRWVSHYCQRLCRDYTYANFTADKGLDESWYKEADSTLLRVRKTRKYDKARYYGLNMHSLALNGTIEFRYHSGTVNAKRILQWVSFILYTMDYALKNYNEDEVKALFDMETGWKKFNAMCGIIKIPMGLKSYLERRVNKFNPDFRIKFNKGKNVRTKERRIYNKINARIDEAEKEIRPIVVKEVREEYKKSGIDRPETRRGRDFFQAIEERVAKKLKLLFPAEYKIMPADGGFIWEKEIADMLTFINQGRMLATDQEEGEVEV